MILHHLKNPFANLRISEDNFRKIAQTHIERTKANNQNEQFTDMLKITESRFSEYETSLTVEAVEAAIKEGKTISVNDALRLIKNFVSRKEGLIAEKFPEGTPEYEEFFPKGLSEYSSATKSAIDTIMKRFIAACKKYESAFGKELAEDAQKQYDNYVTVRKEQLQGIGEVKELDSDSEIKRAALAEQVYANLLSLLTTFIKDTERVKDFFDLSIMKKVRIKEEGTPSPEPPAQ